MALPTPPTVEQTYYVILPLLRRVGQLLLSRQRELVGLSDKQRHVKAQEIETEIRSFLSTTLHQLFPAHSVHGETGSTNAPWQWVINAFDGGRYFFRGLPLFTTSLALREKGEVVLGVVLEPATGNVFSARKGEGASLSGRPLAVSEQKELAGAVAYVTNDKPAATALTGAGAVHVDLDCLSLGLCYVAAGAYDIVVAPTDSVSLFKSAAALLVAREAGALLTDKAGVPLGSSKQTSILVTTKHLQKKTVTILA
ncbi:MAG: inositol monophosphatase family protein [Patescibacteria group bacterium]